jgi:preprotein translocase subunit YajC
MDAAIAFGIFAVFVALVGVLVFKYDRPNRRRDKSTGRGGDFEA